ncbi:TetR/AcrR family transcriptional regulator [Streptomyces sp. NPDC056411]|uniref:TetR/AcrR family transcriptional regulator n=1 Tax=Streptomyces sp. NPDC056411 TaxID=3345813 RepID=UPI0035DBB9ED
MTGLPGSSADPHSPAAAEGASDASAAPAPAGKSSRRRGSALTRAIYEATFEELADVDFEGLAFDKIAARAGTGKSALYRRWSTPAELVLAALADPVAGFGTPVAPETGTLRGDLIVMLDAFARVLDEPRGRALVPLLTQRTRHPELFTQVQRLVTLPHQEILLRMLRLAVDRGEADPRCVTPRVASVGPRMIFAEAMARGTAPEREVRAIVDEVLLPLMAPRR